MKIRLRRPDGIRVTRTWTEGSGRRVPLLILSPEKGASDAPGVLWIHGGGYVTGMKEMAYMSRAVDLVRELGAVAVSPGYRLAPLHPYPAAFDDCYASLLWLRDNCGVLGVRPDRLIVGGESAGGGLAAAVCMKARDENSVPVALQLPVYPMLDHRDTETSRDNRGRIWNTRRNHFGWRMYLGRRYGSPDVPAYASPACQTNWSDLPPCYTFVGNGEPFYAETMTYVGNLRRAGVDAHADIYPTDIHAFDMLYPELDAAKRASKAFLAHVAGALSDMNE